MHGIIFSELRKYVDANLGAQAWGQLLEGAGLRGKMYLPSQEYPDAEAVQLVATASEVTGLPASTLLENFGEFIAPSLLQMYSALVKPEWKTLELLEFTEDTIHKVVRMRNPGAKPAQLSAVRHSDEHLTLTYNSSRKMCAVAKGIIRGLGKHYQQQVSVTETQCMSNGADGCRMEVRIAA